MIQNVKRCSRCGGDHPGLPFKKLKREMAPGSGVTWQWWAPCPTNGEPIMLSTSPVERHDAPVPLSYQKPESD